MLFRSALLAAAIAASSCSAPLSDSDCGTSSPLTLMSYNIASQSGDGLRVIADYLTKINPDFVAVQECGNCEELLGYSPKNYSLSEFPRSAR